MLKKDHKKRRKEVNRQALIKILDIIGRTTYITEADWQKVEVLNSIKKSLCGFVRFVRNRRILGWLGELNGFGFIEDFCKGKRNLDITSLREYINTIYGSLLETVDYEDKVY